MTDTSPLDVATARQQLDDALAAKREAQDALLVAIANDLGERAEQRARVITRDQAEQAHALGREGIARMRAELASVAEELADELARSRALINWPEQQKAWTGPGPDPIQKAIFDFLYGHRIDRLSEVLDRYGFEVSTSSSGTSSLLSTFLPQYLYSDKERWAAFAAVNEATENVHAARAVLQRAEEEQRKASVDDLWN
ncbi:hypothetical protein ACFVTZ_03905 [Cellulosimicrobium cellulans]|uniref:hypothetical protein n=1 Tax=Cellulosimicrobium cellulans TaxID=1710 RepID=UPI0036E95C60